MGYTPPSLSVRKVLADTWEVSGQSTTTSDDLYIRANPGSTYPYIALFGLTNIILSCVASGSVGFYDGSTSSLTISRATTDTKITSIIDGNDLNLLTTGAGVVKFGTYTGGAATDSTGYITIKDAAGNTRKLMVQA